MLCLHFPISFKQSKSNSVETTGQCPPNNASNSPVADATSGLRKNKQIMPLLLLPVVPQT